MTSKSPEYHREWRAKNLDKAREACRKWHAANLDKAKEKHRRNRYGMAEGDFDRMCEEQGQCCAACGEPWGDCRVVVELCHGCGGIRGITHQKCNNIIGNAGDRPARLRKL